MPWIVPSHQAVVLPLKAWRPAWFSGLALCIGSMAPDLEFILLIRDDWVHSHSLSAQLDFTVPLVLALHWLLTVLVLPWLVPRLPAGGPFHLDQLGALSPARTRLEWLRVATSGLVGGLTHVALDGFTHGNHSGWALAYFPRLGAPVPFPGGALPLHDVLQIALTVLLGAAALAQWRGIAQAGRLWSWRGEAPRAVPAAHASECRWAIRWLGGWAAVGAALGLAKARILEPGLAVPLAAYGTISLTWVGTLVAASIDRLRRSFGPRTVTPMSPLRT